MINLFHSRRIFTPHEIAMTFPPLSDEELQELVRDIAQHGQREPITLFGKKILDGWHRYRACRQIGVTPFYREFEGDLKAAVAYARSANAIRRHLTTEQRREAAELMRKLVAELIKAEPTTSDRQIAAQAGSTHPTVAKVRAELEQSGDMESFPYREDSIGRRRKRPTLAEQRAAVGAEARRAHLGPALAQQQAEVREIDLAEWVEERANVIVSALIDLGADDGNIAKSDLVAAVVEQLLHASPALKTLQLARRGIAFVHLIEAALDQINKTDF